MPFDDSELLLTKTANVSEEVNACLDKALLEGERPNRDYLGESLLGDPCARRIQYTFLGTTPDFPETGQHLRIFETGHTLEGLIVSWLQKAGFQCETRDEKGRPFGFSQCEGKIQGHVDGILRKGPLKVQYPLLWECKTAKAAFGETW